MKENKTKSKQLSTEVLDLMKKSAKAGITNNQKTLLQRGLKPYEQPNSVYQQMDIERENKEAYFEQSIGDRALDTFTAGVTDLSIARTGIEAALQMYGDEEKIQNYIDNMDRLENNAQYQSTVGRFASTVLTGIGAWVPAARIGGAIAGSGAAVLGGSARVVAGSRIAGAAAADFGVSMVENKLTEGFTFEETKGWQVGLDLVTSGIMGPVFDKGFQRLKKASENLKQSKETGKTNREDTPSQLLLEYNPTPALGYTPKEQAPIIMGNGDPAPQLEYKVPRLGYNPSADKVYADGINEVLTVADRPFLRNVIATKIAEAGRPELNAKIEPDLSNLGELAGEINKALSDGGQPKLHDLFRTEGRQYIEPGLKKLTKESTDKNTSFWFMKDDVETFIKKNLKTGRTSSITDSGYAKAVREIVSIADRPWLRSVITKKLADIGEVELNKKLNYDLSNLDELAADINDAFLTKDLPPLHNLLISKEVKPYIEPGLQKKFQSISTIDEPRNLNDPWYGTGDVTQFVQRTFERAKGYSDREIQFSRGDADPIMFAENILKLSKGITQFPQSVYQDVYKVLDRQYAKLAGKAWDRSVPIDILDDLTSRELLEITKKVRNGKPLDKAIYEVTDVPAGRIDLGFEDYNALLKADPDELVIQEPKVADLDSPVIDPESFTVSKAEIETNKALNYIRDSLAQLNRFDEASARRVELEQSLDLNLTKYKAEATKALDDYRSGKKPGEPMADVKKQTMEALEEAFGDLNKLPVEDLQKAVEEALIMGGLLKKNPMYFVSVDEFMRPLNNYKKNLKNQRGSANPKVIALMAAGAGGLFALTQLDEEELTAIVAVLGGLGVLAVGLKAKGSIFKTLVKARAEHKDIDVSINEVPQGSKISEENIGAAGAKPGEFPGVTPDNITAPDAGIKVAKLTPEEKPVGVAEENIENNDIKLDPALQNPQAIVGSIDIFGAKITVPGFARNFQSKVYDGTNAAATTLGTLLMGHRGGFLKKVSVWSRVGKGFDVVPEKADLFTTAKEEVNLNINQQERMLHDLYKAAHLELNKGIKKPLRGLTETQMDVVNREVFAIKEKLSWDEFLEMNQDIVDLLGDRNGFLQSSTKYAQDLEVRMEKQFTKDQKLVKQLIDRFGKVFPKDSFIPKVANKGKEQNYMPWRWDYEKLSDLFNNTEKGFDRFVNLVEKAIREAQGPNKLSDADIKKSREKAVAFAATLKNLSANSKIPSDIKNNTDFIRTLLEEKGLSKNDIDSVMSLVDPSTVSSLERRLDMNRTAKLSDEYGELNIGSFRNRSLRDVMITYEVQNAHVRSGLLVSLDTGYDVTSRALMDRIAAEAKKTGADGDVIDRMMSIHDQIFGKRAYNDVTGEADASITVMNALTNTFLGQGFGLAALQDFFRFTGSNLALIFKASPEVKELVRRIRSGEVQGEELKQLFEIIGSFNAAIRMENGVAASQAYKKNKLVGATSAMANFTGKMSGMKDISEIISASVNIMAHQKIMQFINGEIPWEKTTEVLRQFEQFGLTKEFIESNKDFFKQSAVKNSDGNYMFNFEKMEQIDPVIYNRFRALTGKIGREARSEKVGVGENYTMTADFPALRLFMSLMTAAMTSIPRLANDVTIMDRHVLARWAMGALGASLGHAIRTQIMMAGNEEKRQEQMTWESLVKAAVRNNPVISTQAQMLNVMSSLALGKDYLSGASNTNKDVGALAVASAVNRPLRGLSEIGEVLTSPKVMTEDGFNKVLKGAGGLLPFWVAAPLSASVYQADILPEEQPQAYKDYKTNQSK